MSTKWMQTYTGKKFFPMSHNPADICIEDIAHGISNICRYNGHCKRFYSVAEHSVILSRYAEPFGLEMEALMDDASEAYCGDMIRPIKYQIRDYSEIENGIMAAIREKFNLLTFRHPKVIELDNRILLDEAEQAMGGMVDDWSIDPRLSPLGIKIKFLPPAEAELSFLDRFHELNCVF